MLNALECRVIIPKGRESHTSISTFSLEIMSLLSSASNHSKDQSTDQTYTALSQLGRKKSDIGNCVVRI